MQEQNLSILILIGCCLLFFFLGVLVGKAKNKTVAAPEREVIELQIELTKLKIKELKAND
tara:strand:+ start:3489 stop:3668 length:180 start_codon:yes stop_codon:yes gene_type:complete